ncbi:MAG: signal peptide peptidase SppA [Armatimonadetes bacterium]|nr:signal peptide peptidase SppA [Armatimonadota bacterium]
MKRHRKHWILPAVVFTSAFLLAALSGLILVGALAMSAGGGSLEDSIALIHVSGMIMTGGEGDGLFGEAMAGSEGIIDQLEQARKDRGVKAVVLRINSPGGSAAASQEIYQEVRQLSGRKPVISSMGDVAASGAYYIASATNTIVANPATMTGSIGVIMELHNMENLFRKIGLKAETVKSGPHKDLGNPAREITSEERGILQSMIDQVYNQFVDDVTRGRKKMTRAQVKALADGRVYTGEMAKRLGLVDELGGLKAAIRIAAKASGIKGEPNIVSYESASLLDLLMKSTSKMAEGILSDAIQKGLQSCLKSPGIEIKG